MTAVVTAFIRAYHARNHSPKVFDDFMARELFTEEEWRLIGSNLAQCLPVFEPERAAAGADEAEALDAVVRHQMSTVLCRSRYAEDSLDAAVDGGAAQYALLGAGMDTHALRRPDLAGRLTVFEVDHPATQTLKKDRFVEKGWAIPDHLRFVPFDFTGADQTQSLGEALGQALGQAGYDRRKSSFFSLLGVSYYLPREDLFGALRAVAENAAPGGAIVFDYFDEDAFIPQRMDQRMRAVQTIVRMTGEPMCTGLAPRSLAADLRDAGWTLTEDLDPAALDQRYFSGREDGQRAYGHVHLARAVLA